MNLGYSIDYAILKNCCIVADAGLDRIDYEYLILRLLDLKYELEQI